MFDNIALSHTEIYFSRGPLKNDTYLPLAITGSQKFFDHHVTIFNYLATYEMRQVLVRNIHVEKLGIVENIFM